MYSCITCRNMQKSRVKSTSRKYCLKVTFTLLSQTQFTILPSSEFTVFRYRLKTCECHTSALPAFSPSSESAVSISSCLRRSERFFTSSPGILLSIQTNSKQNSGAQSVTRTVRNQLTSMCEILYTSLSITYSSSLLTGLTSGFQSTSCLSVRYSAPFHIGLTNPSTT